MMSGISSPRSSSSTLHEPVSINPHLEEDLRQASELRAEEYGGDDPREPCSKEQGAISLPQEIATPDLNKVGWDGPHDPANPQNWSNRKKWMVTCLCVLMTVNV